MKLQAAEIIDAATMSKKALTQFFAEQVEDAKKQNILLSLHLKVFKLEMIIFIYYNYIWLGHHDEGV